MARRTLQKLRDLSAGILSSTIVSRTEDEEESAGRFKGCTLLHQRRSFEKIGKSSLVSLKTVFFMSKDTVNVTLGLLVDVFFLA